MNSVSLEIDKGSLRELSCSELFEDWLTYKAIFTDPRTVEWYRGTQHHVILYLAKPANSLTHKDAQGFVAKLNKLEINPETVKRKLENLTACWNWAIKNCYLTSNPWEGLSNLIRVPSRPQPKPFTSQEINRIFEQFESSNVYRELTPFVRFLFATGVRTGEAIGLRWSDISPDFSECLIASQLTRGQRKPVKTGKHRTLYLSQSAQQILREVSTSADTKGLIFLWHGKPIDGNNFRERVWKRMLAGAKVPYRKLYNTRHSFISHALEKGVSPATIAQMTGHNVRTLYEHYAGSLQSKPQMPDLF